jgi:hypothetical protein
MSTELWAIIGVVVGALATGGMNVWHAKLQRGWSAKDADRSADRAWQQERQSRLFEAKRSTHAALTKALWVDTSIFSGVGFRVGEKTSRKLGDDYYAFVDEVQHLLAQSKVYSSWEATNAAAWALVKFQEAAGKADTRSGIEPLKRLDGFYRARDLYLRMLRVDLGIDDDDANLDAIKAELDELREDAMAHLANKTSQRGP